MVTGCLHCWLQLIVFLCYKLFFRLQFFPACHLWKYCTSELFDTRLVCLPFIITRLNNFWVSNLFNLAPNLKLWLTLITSSSSSLKTLLPGSGFFLSIAIAMLMIKAQSDMPSSWIKIFLRIFHLFLSFTKMSYRLIFQHWADSKQHYAASLH